MTDKRTTGKREFNFENLVKNLDMGSKERREREAKERGEFLAANPPQPLTLWDRFWTWFYVHRHFPRQG